MLFFHLLLLTLNLSFVALSNGLQTYSPYVVKHGMFPARSNSYSSGLRRRASLSQRQASNPSGCSSGSDLNTNAPKTNIFAGLTNDEAAAVTSFLHDQKSLNLTAAATATR